MIGLLSWTKLPQWATDLILMAVAAAGVWYWHHVTYTSGIKAQIAADAAAAQKLNTQVAAQTAALQNQATAAEHSHDQELADLRAYRASHPVGLHEDAGCPRLPQTGTVVARTQSSSPIPARVQPVLARDSGVQSGQPPRALGALLDALAARADQVSDTLREAQKVLP